MINFGRLSERSFLGRIARDALRLLPKDATVPVLQGRLRGKKWVVGSGEHGYWLGSYEAVKQKAFVAVASGKQVVYDVGANVGFYSLLAATLVTKGGRVFAFEPLPRNLFFLR